METKRLITLMVLGLAIIMGWPLFIRGLARMMGYDLALTPPPATQSAPAAAPTGTDAGTASTTPAGAPEGTPPSTSVAPAGAAVNNGDWSIVPGTQPSAVETIGSAQAEDKTYALALSVSPAGAGLEQVVVNDYRLTLRSDERFTFERPGKQFPIETRSMAVRGVVIDGATVDLGTARWAQVAKGTGSKGEQSVSYELTLAHRGQPALVLRRTYTVYPRNGETREVGGRTFEPMGFESRVGNAFRNLTDRPLTVALKYNGQGVPPSESEINIDAYYLAGAAEPEGVVTATNWTTEGVDAVGTSLMPELRDGARPWWQGVTTTYFLAMQRFEPLPGDNKPVDWFATIHARALTPALRGPTREIEVLITTKPLTVAPAGETGFASRVYFGPKRREVLTNPHYTAPWIQYDRTLVITQWLCAICTWQWLIDLLFIVLKGFHFIFRDWGLAIIGLVALVRLLLHPISKRAQLNMLKFGKLAPEMNKIKERHKDDQEAMNREMMRFYREHGTTQVMGCLPMFLQMPVWIALWQAMQTTFELRHEPFLYGLTWIADLSKPDHLIDFTAIGFPIFHLPLLGFPISGVNVLPFLFGVLQFIQFKIQPKPPTMTPEQEQQQKMTQWMMLILMPLMLYASPSGLMIYMITSFLIGIGESKVVKHQFAKMEEQAARFEIIDADSPKAAKAQKATVRRASDAPKKKGLMAMLEEARERAAQMQRDIERQRKKGK